MKRNINDAINSFNLPENITYQIIFSLLILKNLSNRESDSEVDYKSLWINLVNSNNEDRKNYFIYTYLPSLQNNKESNYNLSLIFRNFHIPFLDIKDSVLSEFIDVIQDSEHKDTIELISDIQYDYRIGINKTLDTEIQKNIIKLLEVKNDDKVLDLNLESSNFLSQLDNNSLNNTGFVQSHQTLLIRFLELLLNKNDKVQVILNNPLFEYNDKLKNKFDIVFAVPAFAQRLSREDYDLDFPIQSSISHNLYIQKALNSLNPEGRCAIVVSDSFLNQSNKDTENLRKFILDKLVAIINLGGIFKPYIGINLSLLILKNDNFNSDILMVNYKDSKTFPIAEFALFTEEFNINQNTFHHSYFNNANNILLVQKEEIINNNFILDFNRYKPLEDFDIATKDPIDLVKDIQMNANKLIDSISSIMFKIENLNDEKVYTKTYQLEEFAHVKLGRPLPKDNLETGDIPYINISDITRCKTDYIDSSEVMISKEFANESNLTIVEPNTILVSVRGTIGKVIISKRRIAISPTLVAIELDLEKVNTYFIYQWFLNKKEYLASNAVGSAQPSLSMQFFRELKFDLPQKEIQDKFEMYQNDLDNIKNSLSLLSEENSNLSKSIFNKILGV